MRIIFALNHPAHYHLFKNPLRELKARSHDAVFVIKDKDILEKVMRSEQAKYTRLVSKRVGKNRISILVKGLLELFIQDVKLFLFAKRFKPDFMIGTDISISHVGKVLNISSIVFNEDDYDVNKFFCRLAYPLCSCIVSPNVCDVGKYKFKKISYQGYQKLSYLHPKVFIPEYDVVKKYIPTEKKYFIIRLVRFSAGHDIEMKHGGITKNTLESLIRILGSVGNFYITNESTVPAKLNRYQLRIDYEDIHHLICYSYLFIADSQSKIKLAEILGTPSIRFNSFVGKISVFEELEHRYGLTIGVHNSRSKLLLPKVKELNVVKEL